MDKSDLIYLAAATIWSTRGGRMSMRAALDLAETLWDVQHDQATE